MTVTLVHPAILWLLPFPLLIRWLLPPRRASAGLVVPFLTRLETPSARQRRFAFSLVSMVRALGLAFAWACVVFAMARPQIVDPPVTRPIPARDFRIYDELVRIEAWQVEPMSHHPRRDIYWWAVAAALIVSVSQQGIRLIGRRPKRPMAPPAPGTVAVADTVPHVGHHVGT